MVDSVTRKLRDGVIEGEQAPAILVRDTVETIGGPLLFEHLLRSTCENILSGRSQAKGVALLVLNSSPESYAGHPYASLNDSVTRFQIVDCYTDPLGWEGVAPPPGLKTATSPRLVTNLRDLDGLLSLIIQSEKVEGSVNFPETERFYVFIDSISVLLRHHSLQVVTNFLVAVRGHGQVAGLCWLVHSDVHEPRTVSASEYLSSTTLAVEPILNVIEGEYGELVRTRQKRRNGRVREQVEKMMISPVDLSFERIEESRGHSLRGSIGKTYVPKVSFNISLTEAETRDRSNVLLPFEHQGSGEEERIYDGRSSIQSSYRAYSKRELNDVVGASPSSKEGNGQGGLIFPKHSDDEEKVPGEIIYLRDSDEEYPDSDEDPDDDLDI